MPLVPRISPHAPRRLQRPLPAAVLSALLSAPALACPPVPPPVRDLTLDRFYADEAGSLADPELLAQHKQATAPVRGFLSGVAKEADGALRPSVPQTQRRRADCALSALAQWATSNALLGVIATKQAEAERRWTLAGAALAYLKVKSFATAEQRAAIETWLTALAGAALKAFEDPGVKRNNHWYWMGVGAGATALATGNEKLLGIARSVMQDGARDVSADGTLPLEMARGARALHYHAFALTALAALAEIGRAKGEDWLAFGDGALARLAGNTAKGLAGPARFDSLTGVRQERPVNPGAGWLDLMRAMSPEAVAGVTIPVPASYRWLGGDVRLLDWALTAATRR